MIQILLLWLLSTAVSRGRQVTDDTACQSAMRHAAGSPAAAGGLDDRCIVVWRFKAGRMDGCSARLQVGALESATMTPTSRTGLYDYMSSPPISSRSEFYYRNSRYAAPCGEVPFWKLLIALIETSST